MGKQHSGQAPENCVRQTDIPREHGSCFSRIFWVQLSSCKFSNMEIHFQLEPSWFGATLQDSKTNQDLPRYQPSCISRNSLNSLSGKRMFSCDALHQLRPPGCVLSEASQVTACDAFGYSSYAHEWIESRTDAICPSQRWMIHHAEMVKVGPSSKAPCTARCGHPCCWLWQRPLMLHIPAPVGCS